MAPLAQLRTVPGTRHGIRLAAKVRLPRWRHFLPYRSFLSQFWCKDKLTNFLQTSVVVISHVPSRLIDTLGNLIECIALKEIELHRLLLINREQFLDPAQHLDS